MAFSAEEFPPPLDWPEWAPMVTLREFKPGVTKTIDAYISRFCRGQTANPTARMTMTDIFESHFHLCPGASLYYQILGPENKHLPLLAIVSISNGTTFLLEALATHLSTHFRVLLYDRRGYNRSHTEKALLPTKQDFFKVHAEDLAALIEHVSPPPSPDSQTPEPIHLFTSSASSAIVLELLIQKPHVVRNLVVHDPVLISLSGEPSCTFFRQEVGLTCAREAQRHNLISANTVIGKHLYTPDEWRLFRSSEVALHVAKNISRRDLTYYLQTEIMAIRDYELDLHRLTAILPCPVGKVVIVQGRDAAPEMVRGSGARLAEFMRVPVGGIVGGHMGYATHVKEFAKELLGFLGAESVSGSEVAKL